MATFRASASRATVSSRGPLTSKARFAGSRSFVSWKPARTTSGAVAGFSAAALTPRIVRS